MKHTKTKMLTGIIMAITVATTMACGSGGGVETSEQNTKQETAFTEETAVVAAEDASKGGETITIGVWSEEEKARLETAFIKMEEETGLKVEFMNYPSDSDFWDNIPAQIAAGTAPDLISCTNEHYLQYIDQGLFEPLNKYVDSGAVSIEGINEVAMSAWKVDNNIYGIPYALNPGVFIVNDTMWQEYGFGNQYPETWDEVLEICKKVKEEHDMPALCFNNQEYHLTNMVISFGGGWDYGKNIASDTNAEALQFLIDAYKKGYIVTPTELGLGWDGAVMIQKSALFSTGGAWYQASFAAEAPDIELKYLSVPRGGNGNGGGTMHTAALVALKNSKLVDAVAQAIQYAFADEDLFNGTVEVTEVIPSKSEYFDTYRKKLPNLAQLVDYLDNAKPFAYPTQSKKFADKLISFMQEAMMDENSELTGKQIVNQLAAEFGTK